MGAGDDGGDGSPMRGAPISDDDLPELARTLSGLRHELAGAGVVIPSEVDVDPDQPFGPWQAVLEALRRGLATLDVEVAGTLLERSLPAATALEGALPAAEEVAAAAGRTAAVDEAVAAAVEDAAALAERVVEGDPGFALTVESFYAGVLAATYATWVVRDLIAGAPLAAGTGLVDGVLRPLAAVHRLTGAAAAAAVLDVAEALPQETWAALADGARTRTEEESAASVRLRAAAAVAGLGGAEAAVVAGLAPAGTAAADALDAAVVIGDAAVAAAAGQAGVADEDVRRLAGAVWDSRSRGT